MLETPSTITPAESPAGTTPGLTALLTAAAFAPLSNLGFIRITGEDRVRWLNGMATNSIQALEPGHGNYNFFLNAQGRIQADATAWLLEDAILLETDRTRISALITLLDHFIIMDDVELHDFSSRSADSFPRNFSFRSAAEESVSISPHTGLALTGPTAASFLTTLGLHSDNAELTFTRTSFNGLPLDLIHGESPLIPHYELWSSLETIAAITQALQASGIPQATTEDLESLRLLEGTPLFGTDIRDKDLPQETAQDARALHFAKGCYLGQEIVERIRSRGQVHRTFSGFFVDGAIPTPGTQLFAAGFAEKPVGELTSAARIQLPAGPVTFALGYIRREALTKDIFFQGGTATPTALPYRT